MREIGAKPDDRASITKIERAEVPAATDRKRGTTRKVTVAEAFAFATALGVPPLSLFIPTDWRDGEEVSVSERVLLPTSLLGVWAAGDLPLKSDDVTAYSIARDQMPQTALTRTFAQFLLEEPASQQTRQAIRAYLELEEAGCRMREEWRGRVMDDPRQPRDIKDRMRKDIEALNADVRKDIAAIEELLDKDEEER
jgi:hypothetical protein